MQKIINDPSCVVDEMLEGFVKANSELVSATENERVLKYKKAPIEGKVGIVTGGGSGQGGVPSVVQPIGFDAPDEQPVSLLIFLLVPEAATQTHLEILSEIAELLRKQN